jgi:hypothetical protein
MKKFKVPNPPLVPPLVFSIRFPDVKSQPKGDAIRTTNCVSSGLRPPLTANKIL